MTQPVPNFSNMTQMEIYENYKLRDLLDLSWTTFEARMIEQYIEHHATPYGKDIPRAKWRITFRRGAESYWTLFTQSAKETEVNPLEALHSLRSDVDLLFGITNDGLEDYDRWIHAYLDEFGSDARESTDVAAFRALIEIYQGMQRVLGDWFPMFLYSENDI